MVAFMVNFLSIQNLPSIEEQKRSQIDVAICNNINNVRDFDILEKSSISDHCPLVLSVDIDIRPSLTILRDCSRNFMSFDHIDINKHLPRTINMKNIDSNRLIAELENLAHNLTTSHDITDLDSFSNYMTQGIYDACKLSLNKDKPLVTPPNDNCNSKNIHAISDAYNFYTHKINCNAPVDEINSVAHKWWDYNNLAQDMEKKEYNTTVNKKWVHCKKNDSRSMWKMIDWKGHSQKPPSVIDPASVNRYFKGIFQSNKTESHPTIADIQAKLNVYTSSTHLLDHQITIDEVQSTLRNVGRGIGLDGIPPSIGRLIPQSLCNVIQTLLQNVFDSGVYPQSWSSQVLFPIEKKGHTLSDPKLRGIAISSLLPRVYDTIIDYRFGSWYIPDKAQSGFRTGQGCSLQLFFAALLIETSNNTNKGLYLLLIDYEKAFDFANRALIVEQMVDEDLGEKFVRSVASMYKESTYVPKGEGNSLGEPILTYYGVTQGRRSSTNFFSFLIKDLPNSIPSDEYEEFMDPFNTAQMADDTILAAENRLTLREKFEHIYQFSTDKYQLINMDKTVFIHTSVNPDTDPISCENVEFTISSLELGKSVPYLGMHLFHTNRLKDVVEYNLNIRMFNVAKYKSWLDINENTPFPTKLLVLDNCVLAAIFYGFEAWGDLSSYTKKLETIELDLLKSALGVKIGTPNDLVYHELNRGSIVSKLMDRQENFMKKIKALNEDDAIVKCLWNKSQHLDFYHYYDNLKDGNYELDIANRSCRITNSEKTMDIRYRELIGFDERNCLYDSFVVDSCRKIVTRWRLSNLQLAIETGRYKRPKVERNQRLCQTCLLVEDEEHALMSCILYKQIRDKHPDLFNGSHSIKSLLNPKSPESLYEIANILFEIEKIHEKYTH